ncbi:MAG TPA: FAD-dependent oxidoreductase, partial [Stellaceae bacterium]|nr:FAD-dependent oxidoreductase [Stellaceae bacterium]
TWIGRDQHRLLDLVKEVGLSVYDQYVGDVDPDDPGDPLNPFDCGAESILRLDGKNHRYKGLYAPIGDEALASLGVGFEQLAAIAGTVPIDRPWEAPDAHALDSQTLGEWIASPENVPFEKARIMLRASMSTLFSGDPNAVSLLSSMLLACGGGKDGFQYYVDSTITEMWMVDEGTAEVTRRMGEKLGVALYKSTPVRRVVHGDNGVKIFSDAVTVRAKYIVVAAPPIAASQIEYDPPLPTAHSQLLHKMAPGAIWKFITVYDTAFWHDMGLTGQTTAPQSLIPVTIDAGPKPLKAGDPPPYGELAFFATGKDAVTLEQMSPEERKETLMRELVERFEDDRAGNPRGYLETNWTIEQWTLGGMFGALPPGALTAFGSALHEPVGRIYWAGTERATLMHGLMEGAVRSGEHTAQDILNVLDR